MDEKKEYNHQVIVVNGATNEKPPPDDIENGRHETRLEMVEVDG